MAIAEAGAAELRISNRDEARGHALADAVQALFPATRVSAGPAPPEDFDLIVNTTPLGMKPGDAVPAEIGGIASSTVVYDIIVNPPVTKLMDAACARGAVTIGGKAMLDAQMALVATFIKQ